MYTIPMISGSDMSVTHVDINDGNVSIWGQAIPGFEVVLTGSRSLVGVDSLTNDRSGQLLTVSAYYKRRRGKR